MAASGSNYGERQMRADTILRVIDGTSAVTLGAVGTIALERIIIPPAATAITAQVAGFGKFDGTTLAADTFTLTGPDSDDAGEGSNKVFDFGGAVNDVGDLVITASVDEVVIVIFRKV